jgi:DNA-binding CsgD family transcriptional regulator
LAATVDDVEQRARHRALACDAADPTVAAELDMAAQHAAGRGATAAAAELAEMAAALTSVDDCDDQQRRRIAAAAFHHFSGDFARASEIYTDLATEMAPGERRADVLYGRAIVGRDDLPTRIALCEQALVETRANDARCAELLGLIALLRWVLGDLRAGLRDARAGLVRAERHGDPRVLTVALGRVGILETWALDITPGLLERGVELELSLPQPAWFNDSPTFMLTQRLYETDELDRSRSMLEEMERAALDRGDEHTRQWVVLQLVIVEWYAGRWQRALEHAGIAQEIAEQTQEAQYGGMIASVASKLDADLGLIDRARSTAEHGHRLSRSVSDEIFSVANLGSLGHIELVKGDLGAAADHLRELPERQQRSGHLCSFLSSWPDTIEALIGVGELERAGTYLVRYEEIAAAASSWSRVGAARSAGLLHAAHGNTDAALSALERGLAADEPRMYPFERARTLVALGGVRRHALQRSAARAAFTEAREIFEALGARPWMDRTDDEIARISGRRGSRDELTEAERRVADLAAQGLRNREIASSLYISVATVEAHLSRVYRKLGLRSRAELAGRFARDAENVPTGRAGT